MTEGCRAYLCWGSCNRLGEGRRVCESRWIESGVVEWLGERRSGQAVRGGRDESQAKNGKPSLRREGKWTGVE